MEEPKTVKRDSSITATLTLAYIGLTIINIGIFWVGAGSNQMRLISEKAISSARSTAFETLRRIQPLSEKIGGSAYPVEDFRKSLAEFQRLLQNGKPKDLLTNVRVLSSRAEVIFSWPESPSPKNKPAAKEILDSLKALQLKEVKNELFIGVPDLVRGEIDLFIPLNESLVLTTKLPLPDVAGEISSIIRLGLGMVVLLLILQTGMGYFIYRRFVVPIRSVSSATLRIADGDFSQIHNTRKKNDEINQLIESFNSMSFQLKENQEVMQLELDIARKIQAAILPKTISTRAITAHIHYNPLQMVSGDYYDFIELSDGSIACLLCDASGHGVPAAFLTIMAKVYFTSLVEKKESPAGVLSAMNSLMAGYFGGSGLYLTAFYLRIFPDGRAVYCNALHPDVILLRKNGETELLKPTGFYVGMMAKVYREYKDVEIKLQQGDRLVLYTDGLTEAINAEEAEFTSQRFIRTTESNRHESSDFLMQNTVKEVAAHQGTAKREDDETLIVIEMAEIKDDSSKAQVPQSLVPENTQSLPDYRQDEGFRAAFAEADALAAMDTSLQKLMQHAAACFKAGDYVRAVGALSVLCQKRPDRIKIFFQFAFSLYRLGEIENAISVLADLIRTHQQFAEAHWLMSLCLIKSGKKTQALASIFRALAEKPEDPRFRRTLTAIR